MKLTITEAENFGTKKDGTQIVDRNGKPKYRSVIKTVERGGTRLTGFVYQPLKAGDVIEADITTEDYNGNTQYRFNMKADAKGIARAAGETSMTMAELKTQTALLRQILEALERPVAVNATASIETEPNEPEEPSDFGFGDEDLPDFS